MPATAEQQFTRDIVVAPVQIRAATINESDRSVEATVATENAVRVVDLRAWETIDEVLLMAGASFPAQARLFPNHRRDTLDDILGSVRGFQVRGRELRARLYLAEGPEDSQEERAWQKIRQGHIDSVSVGYTVQAHTDIEAGQSAVVNRKRYKAADIKMRVSQEWTVREVSLVGIGADEGAKIRSDQEDGEGGGVPVQLAMTIQELVDGREAANRPREEILGDLCGAARISRATLDGILDGEIRYPSKRVLDRIALVLGEPVETLTRAAEEDGLSYREQA